jgi:hypothetical protein
MWLLSSSFSGPTGSGSTEQRTIQVMILSSCFNFYRVIVLLPMYPDGDFLENSYFRTRLQLTQRYPDFPFCLNPNRGIIALLQTFSAQCSMYIDPLDYISFYSLRSWDLLEEKVMTEEIYVRSKVSSYSHFSSSICFQILIVDDRVLIIGNSPLIDYTSANSEVSRLEISFKLISTDWNDDHRFSGYGSDDGRRTYLGWSLPT